MHAYFFHSDVLIDRSLLADQLPAAWAKVLAEYCGGQADNWEKAYQQVVEDWASYWADLTLNEADSLAQWREGWWRVIRALYRLTGQPLPSLDTISTHLDELPYQVGCHCSGWRPGVKNVLQAMADQKHKVAIISPHTASSLIRGMLESPMLGQYVAGVLGPDELGQVGLSGVNWRWLADRVGFAPGTYRLVSDESTPGIDVISPPVDLLNVGAS
jgi:hypothetical protein